MEEDQLVNVRLDTHVYMHIYLKCTNGFENNTSSTCIAPAPSTSWHVLVLKNFKISTTR